MNKYQEALDNIKCGGYMDTPRRGYCEDVFYK